MGRGRKERVAAAVIGSRGGSSVFMQFRQAQAVDERCTAVRTRGGVLLWVLPRRECVRAKGITDVVPAVFTLKSREGDGA
jgi:hypothetical protein